MPDQVICTIIAKNYLAQARCLVASFLEQHPDGRAYVLLIDDLDGCFDPDQEQFTTVCVEEIGIPDLQAMVFRYTVLELSTAVKPFFLEYLFRQHGCNKLCYFDPDIYFYAPIDEIWDLLDSYGIVLTPHLLGFLDNEYRPNERDILMAGAYNLGFIGLSRHRELYPFLQWWQSKLIKDCVVAFDQGLFVDQRWMDLTPSLFSNVYIHRDPACNAAYWNLNHRELVRQEEGDYTVAGQPLRFFHFSGFSPDQMSIVSKHQTRFTFGNSPHLKPLFHGYRDCLLGHGYEVAKLWPYAHNYHDGVRIPDIARTLFRDLEESAPEWDPFRTTPDDQFVSRVLSWLNEPVDDTPPGQPPVTRLALGIYQRRPDLQQACPDVLGHDRHLYVRWFLTRGKDEYGLDDFFLRPMEELGATPGLGIGKSFGRQLGVRTYYGITDWLFRIGVGSYLERKLGDRRVTRVRNFFIRPARDRPVKHRPWPAVSTPQRRVVSDGQSSQQTKADLGVNVIGYLRDETGVGEVARAYLRALNMQGFPVACTQVRSYTARKNDLSVSHLPEGHPYDVNFFHVNADQIPIVYEELGSAFFAGRYNIAYWAWEVSPFPEKWLDHFQYLDEIWVGSNFVQNIVASVAPIPVLRMGVPVERELAPPVARATLGLPEDKFLFLFVFDMLSVFERKNPLGLIEAYRRAFGPDFRDTTLVLKVTKLDEFPHQAKQLRSALASVSGVLIDRYLDRQILDGLFQECDAYVSLHRSEGFGVTMAEAMRLAKPTIATGYSGNVDFMNVTNSYPVDYRLIELAGDCGPYPRGSLWAEPDLDHAAAQMRRVLNNREEAAQKGRRAAADLKALYSGETIASRVIDRLDLIERHRRDMLTSLVKSPETISAQDLPPSPHLRPASRSRRILLEEMRASAVVNPHLPIAWPTWPKGLWPKVVALLQKIVRRLLRWYINPIVEQQNRFNAATVQTVDALLQEISQQQGNTHQDREAEASVE